MIIVLHSDAPSAVIDQVRTHVRELGHDCVLVDGPTRRALAVLGTPRFGADAVDRLPGVAGVRAIDLPYRLASREARPENTIVRSGDVEFGGGRIVIMAGPCAVENREMLLATARHLARCGVTVLRGGAYKPRSSPYSFQGLGEEGLRILAEARAETGLRVVTEVMAPDKVELVARHADILQIGARNMQNFDLLRECGRAGRPVLLKRGLSATIDELLQAAEYVLAHNPDVILCERGIRTFETATRNTLDLAAIPALRERTHLPVVVDPSHGTGVRAYVGPMARAAVAAGADGLLIEVHPDPDRALSDGRQSLTLRQLEELVHDVRTIAPAVGRVLDSGIRRPVATGVSDEVAYQGEPGAFSERAARQVFGTAVKTRPCREFVDVFDAVERGAVGVVPVENTIAGPIHPVLDLLAEREVSIVGETRVRVSHCLIAHPGVAMEDVREVHAHPQAAVQCDRYLRGRGWSVRAAYDTAGSVKLVRDGCLRAAAAIASADAAAIYGMSVLAEGIQDDPRNCTRFAVIAREDRPSSTPDRSSYVIETANRPGELRGVLGVFARHGVNLTSIVSRPIVGRPWEYRFHVDADGGPTSAMMGELLRLAPASRLLGVYAVTS